jgi:hypothetical protein
MNLQGRLTTTNLLGRWRPAPAVLAAADDLCPQWHAPPMPHPQTARSLHGNARAVTRI